MTSDDAGKVDGGDTSSRSGPTATAAGAPASTTGSASFKTTERELNPHEEASSSKSGTSSSF